MLEAIRVLLHKRLLCPAKVQSLTKVIVKMSTYVELNNGNKMPVLGLGTWQSKPGEVETAVKDALEVGYRHIDGAHIYQNEKEVGAGIRAKIADGTVKREELFITSKLWCTSHKPEHVLPAIETTLSNLGLEYVDLYLIHWPFAFKDGDTLFPTDSDSKLQLVDVDYTQTWAAMEELVKAGLAKNIGVSNFNSLQIQRVLDVATVKPVTNQVEMHPYLNQTLLRDFCKEKGIVLTAYSPLGNPGSAFRTDETPQVLEDDILKRLAGNHGKSVAQVVLRYLIQRGNVVIPKSVTKSRIIENSKVFDFDLSDEDLKSVDALGKNFRTCAFQPAVEDKHYPFSAKF